MFLYLTFSHSLDKSEYGSIIGEQVLVNYDAAFKYETEPDDAQPSDKLWTVIIPHFYMGNMNYRSRHPQLVRLAFLCWVRSLLLVDCCISLIEGSSTQLHPESREFGQLLIEKLYKRELKSDIPQKLREARTMVQERRRSDAKGKYIYKQNKLPSEGYGDQ